MDARFPQVTPSALARHQRGDRRRRRPYHPWLPWEVAMLPSAGQDWPPTTGQIPLTRLRPGRTTARRWRGAGRSGPGGGRDGTR